MVRIEREVARILRELESLDVRPAPGAADGLVLYADALLQSRAALSRRDRTPQRVLEHFEDCLGVFEVFPEIVRCRRIADLGSGNGLPGIVITLILNGTSRETSTAAGHDVVLLERSARKAAFLKRVCLEIGARALVWRSEQRLSATGLQQKFDVVLARAVAPLAEMPGLVVRYLQSDGTGVVWAGDPDAETKSACANACRAVGLVGKWTRPVKLRTRGELLLLQGEKMP